jgi:beta-N-acetylhexosaminidase
VHKYSSLSLLISSALLATGLTSAQATPEICSLSINTPRVTQAAWLPTSLEWQQARAEAAAMSLSELAGASMVVSYVGQARALSSTAGNVNLEKLGARSPGAGIKQLGAAGAILFRGNATTGKTAAAEITKLKLNQSDALIAIDQEGGTVVRLRGDIEPPIPASRIGEIGKSAVAEKSAYLSARQLVAAGINIVFAPVADVRTSRTEPSLAARTFGSSADKVGNLIAAQVRGYARAGLMSSLKHYPGLGGISTDTHLTAGKYKGSKSNFCEIHVKPFAIAVNAGAPMVMVGHANYPDFGNVPATANRKLVHDLLREELGFDGIIITDSMSMAASATNLKAGRSNTVRAMKSGVDLLLMPANPVRAKSEIQKALTNGNLSVTERRESIARVIAWRSAFTRVRATLPKFEAGNSMLQSDAIAFGKKWNEASN